MVKQTIHNLRQTEDPGLRYYAAWWLGKFRVRAPEAIAALLEALTDPNDLQEDGSYPLRRNAVRALGKLKDPQTLQPIMECLSCEDYYVREAAAQSLGELAHPAAQQPLLNLLAGGIQAAVPIPGKPHLPQPYDSIFEALGYLGDASIAPMLRPFLEHEVPRLRMSAARALYQLTQDVSCAELIVSYLDAPELVVRRSALMDLGAIGYLPAAEKIAATYAENSIKLIALKGLLEQHLEPHLASSRALPDALTRLMNLMDTLL
jgi:phycocyanobilin lyase alpha subunit